MDATPATILERVATATMFGGGTLAIVANPLPLIRSKAGLDAVRELLEAVAPGNALVFVDELDQMPSKSKGLGATRLALIEAIRTAGGETGEYRAFVGASMTGWIARQAKDLGVRLGPGAADELATRVGGTGRRRRHRPPQPGAPGRRRAREAGPAPHRWRRDDRRRRPGARGRGEPELRCGSSSTPSGTAARSPSGCSIGSSQTTPEPLVVAQLYTRIRQLLDVTDRRAAGENPAAIVKGAKLSPYVAEKLAGMSLRWTVAELRKALDGLFALDVLVKGADGGTSTEEGRRLAFTLWLADTLRAS